MSGHTVSSGLRILVGVTGGIAAYKVVGLVRQLVLTGHDVRVLPTAAALNFVGEPTWEAISHNPVASGLFEHVDQVQHVALGKSADLVIVAPATADILAKAASGQADNLLLATLLTATCPVVFAPAMHTEMWLHPATAENVSVLRGRGATVIDPDEGELTGSDVGPGRLPDIESIVDTALALVSAARLSDNESSTDNPVKKVLVTAGGTREVLDPVRFLGNRSSGKQGIALARAAFEAGADVTLVAANVDEPIPAGIRVVRVSSTAELAEATFAHAPGCDAVYMAAAVSDFRPRSPQSGKIKKESVSETLTLELVKNQDILAELVHSGFVTGTIVGFAAETAKGEDLLALGRAKRERKGCDFLVVNEVGEFLGFGADSNTVLLLNASGEVVFEASDTKLALARNIVKATL